VTHQFPIEVEQETDGRWIAAIPEVPGMMAYGETQEQAIAQVKALILQVIGGETVSEQLQIQSISKALILQVIGGETALLSEQSLAKDWNREEEDAAWSYLRAIQQE
jgi:predicted RNase H-like HicB family nuclease